LISNDYPEILDYLVENRKISKQTLEKYKVGIGMSDFRSENDEIISVPCVYFPLF
jgi:hypothetical protein